MSRKPHLVRTLLLFLTTFLLLTGAASALNQVRIECPAVSATAVAGDSIAIKVHLTNDDNLGAFTLGFHYNSNMVQITRVTAGPMITALTENGGIFKKTLVPASNEVLAGWYDSGSDAPLLPQVDGLAFTFYLKLLPGVTAHCVDIDSVYVPPAGPFIFAPVAGGKITPEYSDCGTQDVKIGLTDCPSSNNPPNALCQDATVNADGTCHASASIDNGSYDNDAGDAITLAQDPAGPYALGNTLVTLIVTDKGGLADTCQATVHVLDKTKPTIACPANIVKGNDAGLCGATVTFSVGATDFCTASPTIVSSPPSGSSFPIGLTTVKSIATDAAGNADTCFFNVTINDTQKPAVTCPANIVKGNDAGVCGAVVTYDPATVIENCGTPTLVYRDASHQLWPSGSTFPVATTTVYAVAADAAGNKDSCSFTVTINDTQNPVVTCPTNIVVTAPLNDTDKVVEFTPTVTDNCPGVTYVATPASGSAFLLGITPVKVVATDAHGLKDSCQFTVEVKVGTTPDFAIEATPDSIVVMQGIPDSLLYSVDLTSIYDYSGSVNLSVSALPTGVVLNFGANTINVPNSTTLGGHTSVSTPAGEYELTITATEAPTKLAHSTKVLLIVIPCSQTPFPVVSQQVFDVHVEAGQNLFNDSLWITNSAPCGNLYWLASSDQAWVTPDPNQGSVNAGETPGSQVYLKYTTAALDSGIYVAHVTFVEDKKKTPGAEVTINLTVTPKPPSADSIRVAANDSVNAGSTVAVPVHFNNNEPLGGMSVGLHWNSSDVTLDSVSFVGSRIDYVNFKFATINAAHKTVLLGMATLPPELFLMPGSGLWATMWFTAGSNCPVMVAIDSQYIAPGGEVVFVDSLAQIIYPQFAAGSIQVDCIPTYCINGSVVDGGSNPISGATVELYGVYPPSGSPLASMTTGPDGAYKFCPDVKNSVFSVRAYKSGYYPDYDSIGVGNTLPLTLTLKPIVGTVTPTNEWVNLYCDLNALFNGTPVLPGSVIEAYDPQGVLCGQWVVSQAGTYGFMPVYADDSLYTAVDEGCRPGDLITIKVDGFVVTMANGPIHWGTNGDRYEACFDGTPVPQVHCLILKQGWNLVSWNVDTPNDSIMILAKDVMDNVDVILSFEQGAQTYDPKLPDFSTLHFADHYHGFWFRMSNEDTLCLEGPIVAASTPIDLEQSWNLVSYLPTVPYTVPVALASIFDKVVVVLGYDQGALTCDPAYLQFYNNWEMKRDFGYWIKTTGAATLVYPGPILAKTTPSIHKSDFTPRTSQSNSWVNLYGFNVKLNGETLPVGTVIEAYDASGALVGENVVRSAGRFGFMPVYGAETLTGDAVGKSAGSAITLKVNGEVAEQTVTWTENGDRIRINELTTANKNNGNLPTSFTLKQNYPNPFNPETAIDYVVAQSGHVELAIYNILGDKIKTLVSGYQAAGNYTIKWQADTDGGTSVASGVYFYKLTAGDYTDTKKMTLLK